MIFSETRYNDSKICYWHFNISPQWAHQQSISSRRFIITTSIRASHKLTRHLAATFLCLCLGSGLALAGESKVVLSGDQEVPPVSTGAGGNGSIMISDNKAVSGMVTTTGMTGSMAHIHLGAAGKNGPVAIPLTKSGDNGWMVPAGASLSDEQYAAYKAGGLYVNVHSIAHPGGEIRAQIKP